MQPQISQEVGRPGAAQKKGWARRALALTFVFVLIVAACLALASPANAMLSDTMRDLFENELNGYVTSIMNDTSNGIYQWSWMMFLALSFILIVKEVLVFIADGMNAASHLEAVIYFFVTLFLMGSYSFFTDAIWGIGVGLGNGYQQHLVGNTDNFFLSQWVTKSISAVSMEELSILDSIDLLRYSIAWGVAVGLLELAVWTASIWTQFGYALAKIVGLIFIPFLLLPATRVLFDNWFRFLVGFVVLLIMLKATQVVAAITVKATLATLDVSWTTDYGDPANVVEVAKENFYLLADTAAMLLIAALFVLSSFVFAVALGKGVGSASGALGSVSRKAISRMKG